MTLFPDATVLVTFVLVWILVAVLNRVFFKPLGRVLDGRASRIDGDNDAARKALEAYERDLRRIEDRLREARAASDEIWAKAELEALRAKSRLIQDIQAESRAEVETAKRELAAEIERLKGTLEGETAGMAEDIERRLLN